MPQGCPSGALRAPRPPLQGALCTCGRSNDKTYQWGRESRGAEMSAQTHGVVTLSIHSVSHICTACALGKENVETAHGACS